MNKLLLTLLAIVLFSGCGMTYEEQIEKAAHCEEMSMDYYYYDRFLFSGERIVCGQPPRQKTVFETCSDTCSDLFYRYEQVGEVYECVQMCLDNISQEK